MTFTRTYQFVVATGVALLTIVPPVFADSDVAPAQTLQAPNRPSAPSLAGNQLAFDAGVHAYDAGNPAEAFAIWLPLAKAGDLAAQRNVAHLLRRGVGVDTDLVRALWFYERAARAGLASAALNAGMMRLEKDADYFDERKAAEWLALASSAGSPIAQWELAKLLEHSDDVPRDSEAALILLRTAAKTGHEKARARLVQLGDVPPTPEQGEQTNHVLQEDPTIPVSPEIGAAFMQGIFHFEEGQFEAAATVWTPLAEQGVIEAQYRLGRLYEFGMGVERDVALARHWLDLAKNGGHARASVALSALPPPVPH